MPWQVVVGWGVVCGLGWTLEEVILTLLRVSKTVSIVAARACSSSTAAERLWGPQGISESWSKKGVWGRGNSLGKGERPVVDPGRVKAKGIWKCRRRCEEGSKDLSRRKLETWTHPWWTASQHSWGKACCPENEALARSLTGNPAG